MADFSFSFDSDNPFAEPEQTPAKAASASETSAAAATSGAATPPAPVADAPAATTSMADIPVADALVADNSAPIGDEFSLDSFDFAFGEDDAINDTLPTRNTPLDEASPRQLTPGEAAFAEFNFGAPDSAEKLEVQTPETEMPQAQAPEIEMPQAQAPEIVIPEIEALETQTPKIEMSEVQAPEIEMLESSAPNFETLETELPDAEVPAFEAPKAEAPAEPSAPEVETPNAEVEPEVVAPIKASPRATRSDLEEFNAFTYDFGMPTDEIFGAETPAIDATPVVDETLEVAPSEEIAEGTPLDFLDTEPLAVEPLAVEPLAVEPLAVEPLAVEPLAVEPLAVEPLAVEPLLTEPAAQEPAAPHRISTRNVVEDAPLLTSIEDQDQDEAEVVGQTEGEFRRLRTRATMKVAILGASGIGKNHARWFHHHGCQVVGFLGTSPDSTTQTEADLSADFDFQGNAYTDLETLLQTEKPDIVCVATPPPLHFSHVLQSLEAGAHVLCEKPLVYAPTRKFRENRDGAKELVKVAAKRKLNLGTQLQYGGATPILCKLAGLTPTDVGDFAMELETLNPNSPRDPRELWIDLGPHPISVAQMLAGTGSQLAEETIVFEPYQDDEKTEVLARFGINCADGRLLMVRAVVRALRGENLRKPRRRFSFNGHAVTYAPLQSVKNGFQAQFVAPDGYASVYPDPVDYLVGNFVNACRNGHAPMITGDFGRENLEWMLKVGTHGETR